MRAIVVDDRRSAINVDRLHGFEVVFLFDDDTPKPVPYDPAYARLVRSRLQEMQFGEEDYLVVCPPIISMAIFASVAAKLVDSPRLLLWDSKRDRYVPLTIGEPNDTRRRTAV